MVFGPYYPAPLSRHPGKAKDNVGARLVELGNFSFKYRGYMLPIAVILLLIPGPHLFADPSVAGAIGFAIAVLGQAARIANVGLAYIIRGGKDHKVYAEELVTSGLYSTFAIRCTWVTSSWSSVWPSYRTPGCLRSSVFR